MTSASAIQYSIEDSWSKQTEKRIVKTSLGDAIPENIEMACLEAIDGSNPANGEITEIYDDLLYLLLHQKKSKPIQAVATPLGMAAGFSDKLEALIYGISLLKTLEPTGLFYLEQRHIHENEWYVCSNAYLDRKTLAELDRLQYLPPMQIVPKDWNNNTDGGWLMEHQHIMLGKSVSKHNEFQCYDVVNSLQQIPWTIDTDTFMSEANSNKTMNRKKFLRTLNECLGKEFYFVWRYDARGRMYSSGYDLNIQSNEYGKALLSMHHKEKVTKQGLDHLYIAIANHAGKDKMEWSDRIAWAKNLPEDVDCSDWDEPILGRKAIRAFHSAVAGKSIGYTMSLDATSSGVQIMAALSGCRETARYTNMVDPTKRYDLYKSITDTMNSNSAGENVERKTVKKAAMTH